MNFRSFAIRTLIALIFGPLIILSALAGGYFWLVFVGLVVMMSVYEFHRLADLKGAGLQLFIGIFFSLAIVTSFYYSGERLLLPILIALLLAIQFVELYRQKGSPLINLSATFYAPVYYALGFGSFILIREFPAQWGLNSSAAGTWIVLLILTIWVCDTAAYIGGSYFGRHKLMERISPKKSIEGAVFGFVFALLAAALFHQWFVRGLRLQDALFIGLVVGSIGQYGDLFESLLKRDAGVKDSSNLIPGHGGILDRFDSLTICAPVVYLYLRFIPF